MFCYKIKCYVSVTKCVYKLCLKKVQVKLKLNKKYN